MRVGKFERELERKGQVVYQFSKKYLFILKERFYTAGKKHWAKAVKNGETVPGFSLNSAVWETIEISRLVVFEVAASKFFQLVDKEKARRLRGRERKGRVLLYVLPLSAFQTVRIEDLENIISSPVPYSRNDFTTRQQKLGVKL